MCARLVLGANLTGQIRQSDPKQDGGTRREASVQPDHELGDRSIDLRDPAALVQESPPLSNLRGMVPPFLFYCPVQQAEPLPHVDVFPGRVAGRRWQVVHRDAGQRLSPPMLGGRDRVAAFEPQHPGAEDPAVGHVRSHPVGHRTQVLPDHDCTDAVGLQRENPDQCLMVHGHVRALIGREPLGNPPLSVQTQHMVDPDATGVAQRRPNHVPIGHESGIGERFGKPGRRGPVLAHRVVHVRWRTHARVRGHDASEPPGVATVGMDAHRDVVDDSDAHAGGLRRGLSLRQLSVELVLHPTVELDSLFEFGEPRGDGGRPDIAQILGPLTPSGAVLFGESAPQREVLEPDSPVRHEHQEFRIIAISRGPQLLERGAFHGPDVGSIDPVGGDRRDLFVQIGQPLTLGFAQAQAGGDAVDVQVQRIGEPAGHRQVRGLLDRLDRAARIQRIHQHEIAIELGRLTRELIQVSQIAQPPRPVGAHRVQLHHETPAGLDVGESVRGHDQRAVGDPLLGSHLELVIAERQIGGDLERCLADEHIADLAWLHEVLDLGRGSGSAAVLPHQVSGDRGSVRNVHPNAAGAGAAVDVDRWQHPMPGPQLRLCGRGIDLDGSRG